MRVTRELKYRVPEALIRYLVNELDPTEISEISLGLSNFRLVTGTQVSFGSDFEDYDLDDLAKTIIRMDRFEKAQSFVRSVVQTGNQNPGQLTINRHRLCGHDQSRIAADYYQHKLPDTPP